MKKSFFANNWQYVLSAFLVLITSILMMVIHKPAGSIVSIMIIDFVCFGVNAISFKNKWQMLAVATSVFVIWLMSFTAIPLLWISAPLLFMFLISILNYEELGFQTWIYFFMIIVQVGILATELNNRKYEELLKPENAIEAVIAEIEKRNHNDVIVVLETQEGAKILPFESSVEDAWRLEKGDTISVFLNEDKDAIISFER